MVEVSNGEHNTRAGNRMGLSVDSATPFAPVTGTLLTYAEGDQLPISGIQTLL